jgi:hypothetical protein
MRKPALDLSDVVRQECTLIDYRSIAVECISGTVAGFARPRRAVKPNAAWRRAEGAGLTAKARTEQSSMSPQYASSSDTVREIKYQILHIIFGVGRINDGHIRGRSLEGHFFFLGTLLPFLRAWESAMAIACLRLFTLPPLPPLPLFAVPLL